MKGPGLRADIDVRRLWKCPRCGRTIRYSGDVVSHACHCQKEGTFMQMMEEVKPAAPGPDSREVRGSEAIPEPMAAPSEGDFGEGIAPQPVLADDIPPGNPPESPAADGSPPA